MKFVVKILFLSLLITLSCAKKETVQTEDLVSYTPRHATAVIKINVNHNFYDLMYKPLEDADDKKLAEILDLLLMSWTRLEDELVVQDIEQKDFSKIRDRWGQHLTDTLDRLNKVNN